MNLALTAIKRPIFITCVFILILAVGFLSMMRLPVDLFPNVTFPVILVMTRYPGASPKEIEVQVSKVIEDELSSIAGLKTLRSINKDSTSTVVAEFTLSTDVKYAEQQVRDKVASAKRKLPTDILEPTLRRMDPADQPIIYLGITGSDNPAELYDYANEVVKTRLQKIDQVGLVEILGGRKREIHVELDQDKLARYQVAAQTVADRIGAAGENVPAGKITTPTGDTVFRTLAEFRNPQEIASTIVSFFANETPIRVRDLGRITDTLEDESNRLYLNDAKSLQLFIFRQNGANTIQVADKLKIEIEKMNQTNIDTKSPYRLAVVRDGAKPIRANVDDVKETIRLGIILTFVVVLFFLGNLRSTLITSLALPNSLLGAFVLMSLFGFTINIMTLLALSLAVGLLIDDAIVVRENIFRHLEMGASPFRAAFEGTQEVTLAVIATTFTVIAVFGPIAFLSGVVGQFFKEFGLTVCFAMLISLFDALTMAPMLSAYFAGKTGHEKDATKNSNDTGFFYKIQAPLRTFDRWQSAWERHYATTLKTALNFPATILIGALAIFISSIVALKYVPKTFLPPQDNGEYQVQLELPPGSSLDQTDKVANEISTVLRKKHPEIDTIMTLVGSRDLENHKSTLNVTLVPSKKRNKNTTQVKDITRLDLLEFKQYSPIVTDFDAVGGGQRPFNLVISGPEMEPLEAYATKVYESLSKNPALKDVSINQKPGNPEYQILIDPEKAQSLGVSTKIAGRELRTLVEGLTPAILRQSNIEYNIRVRAQPNQRDLKNRMDHILVPNINGRVVSLAKIASAKASSGPATINRENRNRSITIAGDISADGQGMQAAITDAKQFMEVDQKPPTGISFAFTGQAENFQELLINMVIAIGLGVLFIYLVLSSLYESFVTPLNIMLVLPLALCGAFYALLITGKFLDLFSMIGCILLLGVATKNSILLVDYTKQLIDKQGKEMKLALIEAGQTRLRPILMTSFALIAGMTPVAIGLNEASRQRTSMGIVIIGGILSSTFLTLFVIPAGFIYIEKVNQWSSKLFRGKAEDVANGIKELEKA